MRVKVVHWQKTARKKVVKTAVQSAISVKKCQRAATIHYSLFVIHQKMITFASAFENARLIGALDEWLSLRSAKPSTAVRIRHAPHSKKKAEGIISLSFFVLGNEFE